MINSETIEITWDTFKSNIAVTDSNIRIVARNGDYVIISSIRGQKVRCVTGVTAEKDEYDSMYGGITTKPISSTVAQQLDTLGSSIWLTTHDYCKQETWWQKSVKVDDEALSGANFDWQTLPYTVGDVPIYVGDLPKSIINLQSNLLLNEKDIVSHTDSATPWDLSYWFPEGHNLIPTLTDYQGNPLTYTTSATPGSGEWTVLDWVNGSIKTGDDHGANAPLLSYNYPTISTYEMRPLPGKLFKIGMAEVNSQNADWDSMHFWFEVTAANGAYVAARRMYQSEADVIAASVGAPQAWRDWDILQWPYDEAGSPIEDVRIPIKSSAAMAVNALIPQHRPYTKYDENGKRPSVIITIYAVSFNE